MNRKMVTSAVILGFMVLLTCLLLNNKDYLSQSPFSAGIPIQNLSTMTTDGDGNLYMVVEARSNIVKTNKDGIYQYNIKPTGSDKNDLFLFSELAVDQQGYLYACRTDLDNTGTYVISEKVLCFSPAGQLVKIMHQENYPGNNRPLRSGNIKSLDIKGDYLYFNYLKNDRIYLYSINLKQSSLEKSIIAYLPQDSYVADITGTAPGKIFYSTQRGEIYQINAAGKSELLYPSASSSELGNFTSGSYQTPDRTFPIQLKLYQDKLYFIDTFANEIRYLSLKASNTGETVFSQNNLAGSETLSVLKDMVVGTSLSIAVRDRIYQLDADGQLAAAIETAAQPFKTRMVRVLIWLLPLLILGLFIYWLRYIYVEILQRRLSLIIKLLVVFTPIIILGMVILSWFMYLQFSDREEKEVYRQLVVYTVNGINRLNPMRLENISSPRDYMNEDYTYLRDLTIESQIHRGIYGESLDEAGLYTAIYKLENDQLYAIVDYDNSVNMYRPITIAGEFKKVLETGEIITDKASDENGVWMFAMAPIYDDRGNIIGIFESGVDRSGFNQERLVLFKGIAVKIGFITLFMIALFVLVVYFQLQSIRKLRHSVAEIAQGNWETAVSLDTGDEVADLGNSVNDMATHIRNYIQEITDLSEAYYRFVPQQILNLLGKKSLIDVTIGDQVRQDISILSLNIHSFYRLSGTMSPEDNFNFINSYLSWMGPIVSNNDGLIDKYTGSGFVALFPDQSEAAVQAAILLRRQLVNYNAGRARAGYEPIDFGIGIHKGPVMLGVIGEAKKMAATIISDNVNVAAFLQMLTGKLACSIIITDETLQAIKNAYNYQYRCLGRVHFDGRDETLLIYDVFEGEFEDIRILKLESRELFEEGVALYQDGHFYDARSKFIEVIKQNRTDEIARVYFYLCEEYCKSGPPESWDGAFFI